MKNQVRSIYIVCLILQLFSHVGSAENQVSHKVETGFNSPASGENYREAAFEILNAKCNTCHRKENPFMVFTEKNMERRADRIYQAVFVNRRMPKGNVVKLTKDEYAMLQKWINQ